MKSRLAAFVVAILLICGLWSCFVVTHAYSAPKQIGASHTAAESIEPPVNNQVSSPIIQPSVNQKVIGRIIITEILMLCVLLLGIVRWPDTVIDYIIIFWSFSQSIIAAILIGCNQADTIMTKPHWPIGAAVYGLMLIGVVATCRVVIFRRKHVASDDLQTELARHDRLTGLLRLVVLFPIVPLVMVPNMAFFAIVVLICVLVYAYFFERNRRMQLRRQLDRYGLSVYELRLSTLNKTIGAIYPGYSVVIRESAEGDHRIFGRHGLTRCIAVSMAAVSQLTSEQLTMMTAMLVESHFASHVKIVGWVLVWAAILYTIGIPPYWIFIFLLCGYIDGHMNNLISVAADRRAISRLGSVLSAISLLQQQLLDANEPSQEIRAPLEHRLRAIVKREQMSLQI
ncbi:MAG: hypothetical protein ACYC1M_16615 [Armatimonadota bacterium]